MLTLQVGVLRLRHLRDLPEVILFIKFLDENLFSRGRHCRKRVAFERGPAGTLSPKCPWKDYPICEYTDHQLCTSLMPSLTSFTGVKPTVSL